MVQSHAKELEVGSYQDPQTFVKGGKELTFRCGHHCLGQVEMEGHRGMELPEEHRQKQTQTDHDQGEKGAHCCCEGYLACHQ
jgi:hypothetical protein